MSSPIRVVCFLLPVLLVVPFDPQWPDFERARRGLLMVLVGSVLVSARLRPRLPPRPLLWLMGLAGLGLASALWAHDALSALEQGCFLLALSAIPWIVPEGEPKPLLLGFAAALILTSAYGIAQSLGLNWPMHYTVPHEHVSTLGNRNVAAEWTAAATPLALFACPILGWVGVVLADVYLWANGGRAGLVAFHVGVVLFATFRSGRFQLPKEMLGWTAGIFVVGALIGTQLRQPPPTVETTPQAALAAPPADTFRVRQLLWAGSLELAVDHPIAGVGGGNYVVHFPRYRAQEEIDISTRGHRFGTRVRVAHNDLIHLVCELGLLGLIVLGGFALSLWQARASLGPVAVVGLATFVPIAMLRAPLFNAPAAASLAVALALGTRELQRREASSGARLAARFAGTPLLLVGAMILQGETAGADFFRAKRTNDAPAGAAALDTAIAWDPFTSDWRLLRSQIHHLRGRPVAEEHLAQTLADLHSVLERRPCSYRALADLGYLGLAHPKLRIGDSVLLERGREAVKLLLELDRKHPIGLLLGSQYAFHFGRTAAGISALALLGQEQPIVMRLRQFRRMTLEEKDPKRKLALARVQLELRKLLRRLFPNSPELRK